MVPIKQYIQDKRESLYFKVAEKFGIDTPLNSDITDLFRPNLKKGIALFGGTVALFTGLLNPPAIYAQENSNELEKDVKKLTKLLMRSADKTQSRSDSASYYKKIILKGKYIDKGGNIYDERELSELNKKQSGFKPISIIKLAYDDEYPKGPGKSDELKLWLFEDSNSYEDYLTSSDIDLNGLHKGKRTDIVHDTLWGDLIIFFNYFGVSRFPPSKSEDIEKVNSFYHNLIRSILKEMLKSKD